MAPAPEKNRPARAALTSVSPLMLAQAALIAAVTWWIYWPGLRGGFIWDDGWYITTNPLLHDASGLWKFWFAPGSWVEYYPISETVLWTQWQLWGTDTLGYHLTNVSLHLLSALLVWRLLAKFGLRLAWLGGLLFAVHPAQVESVAYICELKNTLSLPFFLLAMGRWIDYDEHRRRRDYAGALGLFVAGMLCKITMAAFPFLLLLYAWWKRGRIEARDARACLPFLIVALALSFLTIWTGQRYEELGRGHPDIVTLGDFFARLAGSGEITAFYFARAFLPIDALSSYPFWPIEAHAPGGYLFWIAGAAGLFLLWKQRRGWGRHALLGLGFFALTLAPFLGFIAVSYMSFTWVMDHFLYLPIIGLIGLVIAAAGDLSRRAPAFGALALVLVGAVFAVQSHDSTRNFLNEETFWTAVLRHNPQAWVADENLSTVLLNQGRDAEALVHARRFLAMQPDYSDAHYTMGLVLEKMGEPEAAVDAYREAARLDPANGKIYVSEGTLLVKMGQAPEAIAQYRQAIRTIPAFAPLRYNLGSLLLDAGDRPGAIEQLDAAVQLDPKLAKAQENLGSALAQSGRVPEAIPHFAAAVAIDPAYVIARNNLALALAQTGHLADAIEQFQQVLAVDPDNAQARASLAKLQGLEKR